MSILFLNFFLHYYFVVLHYSNKNYTLMEKLARCQLFLLKETTIGEVHIKRRNLS
jgi:hypothetical protein